MWAARRTAACLLACAAIACSNAAVDCDRSGCDALNRRAADDGETGVAGIVAEEADFIGNGCQRCPFGSASIAFWATDGTRPPSEVTSGSPTASVTAHETYSLALDPGAYLACVLRDCTSLTVNAGHRTTLNVRVTEGPAEFVVH